MTTQKHLFLDLEDTIITPVMDGWWKTELINVDKIRHIIDKFQPNQVNLFSFAIWNKQELEKFNAGTRPMLEKALNISLSLTPTVDDHIIPACCSIMKIPVEKVDFMEVSAFWSKHESFRLFCRHNFKNSWTTWKHNIEVMLLDDMVINENFEWPDLHIKGQIINIDS